MNSRVTLWIVIGVLFIFALFLTFKAGSASASVAGAASSVAKSASSSYGAMVGGC